MIEVIRSGSLAKKFRAWAHFFEHLPSGRPDKAEGAFAY
jgi:hypothetical protein